jgi:hypothetical protein
MSYIASAVKTYSRVNTLDSFCRENALWPTMYIVIVNAVVVLIQLFWRFSQLQNKVDFFLFSDFGCQP